MESRRKYDGYWMWAIGILVGIVGTAFSMTININSRLAALEAQNKIMYETMSDMKMRQLDMYDFLVNLNGR